MDGYVKQTTSEWRPNAVAAMELAAEWLEGGALVSLEEDAEMDDDGGCGWTVHAYELYPS